MWRHRNPGPWPETEQVQAAAHSCEGSARPGNHVERRDGISPWGATAMATASETQGAAGLPGPGSNEGPQRTKGLRRFTAPRGVQVGCIALGTAPKFVGGIASCPPETATVPLVIARSKGPSLVQRRLLDGGPTVWGARPPLHTHQAQRAALAGGRPSPPQAAAGCLVLSHARGPRSDLPLHRTQGRSPRYLRQGGVNASGARRARCGRNAAPSAGQAERAQTPCCCEW